jgi:acyl-CoA synthetase (AMP-forming)/AMP-acid ligase II/acyl carrier protein
MSVMLLAVSSTSIAAPLNPSYREAEFQSYLNDIHADCVIVLADDRHSPVRVVARKNDIPVVELASDGVTLIPSSGATDIFGRKGKSFPVDDEIEAKPDDIALILLTSGSTGHSKKVPLTHRNLCASVADVCHSLDLDHADICLSMWEQFHIGGMVDLLLVPLASGGQIISTSRFDAESFFQILETRSPTWFQGVPTTLHEILVVARKTRRTPAKTSLRFIRSVASALSPQLMEQTESFFQIPVVQTFGMTEAGPLITTNPLPPGIRKAGSTGPSCGPMISIRDPSGQELPAGETGEILVKGENVVTSYESNKEATAQSFRDGWFHTGDTGYLDADGYLFLKGRIKEQINRGGEKIIPQEIDDILAAHPEIEQAASFSMKHATLGEDVGAAVVLMENSTLDEGAIRRYVASQLSDFKVPKKILFLPSLPRSTIGKIKRDTLAALADSGSETPTYARPETKLQELLAKIWAEELGVKKVGIDDDFFKLGGDSLSSVRLALAVETLLEIRLDAASLGEILTVRQLATLIEALPNHEQIIDRVVHLEEDAEFTQASINEILSTATVRTSDSGLLTPISASEIKEALLKCGTEHEFESLLELFYTELTPGELAPLADVSLDPSDLARPHKQRFLSAQAFLAKNVVPLAAKQSWQRKELSPNIRLYTGQGIHANNKTLIVGFAGNMFRLMMPMWTFLSNVNSAETDLLMLWDPARNHYSGGIPELADNFPDFLQSLKEMVSKLEYRRVVSFGTSAGGLPALCAGLASGWDATVSVNAAYPLTKKGLLPVLKSLTDQQTTKRPEIRLYYSELNQEDLLAAVAIAKIAKGEVRPLFGHALHNVLWTAYQKGELPKLFSEFFS